MVPFWRRCARGGTGYLLALLLWGSSERSGITADAAHIPVSPPYIVWRMEEGWHQSAVTAIAQSQEGYLWLGTYTGLVRFDGVRYTVFDSSNTPGLQNSRVTSLHEDARRVLWIGHETGELTRMSAGEFLPQALPTNWQGSAILGIGSDSQGDVWILGESGQFMRVRDGRSTRAPGAASSTQKPVLTRRSDGVQCVTTGGVVSEKVQGELMPMPPGFAESSDFVQAIAPARDGRLWVIKNGRILKWGDGKWEADLGPAPSGAGAPTAFMETRSGSLLFGTVNEGLHLIQDGNRRYHFSRTNGLSHDWVRALCEDHEGNIWVGTGLGLDTLRPRKVDMVSAPDGFGGSAVQSFNLGASELWVGTEGSGVYRWQGERWLAYTEAAGISNRFVWSVLRTRTGDLLAGTWGAGLVVLGADDRFEPRDDYSRIDAPVVCLFESSLGEVWVGTTAGLFRFKENRLVWSSGKEELTFPDVRTVTEDRDGTIWFGMSGGGLGRLRDGVLRQYRKADGLSSDFVQALLADTDGTLWIGTSDNGLCRLRDGKFAHIGADHGLPASVIAHVVDDGNDCLWFGSNRGIFRATKADLHRAADRQAGVIQFVTYGKSEGLASLNCSGGFQPGATRASDGQVWFPTARGLAVIDPRKVTVNPVPPPVVIEQLLVDGEAVPGPGSSDRFPSGATIEVAPGKQRFEFHFTGLSYAAPEKVRFKYRLDGLEADWTDSDAKRLVQYSYLPPGFYTFRVTACNNDGVWNPSYAALSFTVLPEFYQTWWFRLLAVAAGAGVVGAGVLVGSRRRVRRKLEQVERQRALERERARIARDIHDDLGASLTRITMLSQGIRAELEDRPEAAADLDQVYSTARELTRAMDEIVWAVNPKHDTLDSLITYLGRYAQTFLSAAGVRCRLEMPLQLPPWTLTSEIRHNIFLAFKEALNNVVKHARATEVRVALEVRPGGFDLLVVDNGRGFDFDAQLGQAGDSARAASGNGLANMRKRLEETGGRCEWQTQPGEGTRVKFSLAP